MKLSEAIILGSTLAEEPLANWSYCKCLCGVAVRTFSDDAKANLSNREAREIWPWLLQPFDDRFPFGENFVSHLCQEVVDGRMTLEQAVDRIREVEPEERSADAVRGFAKGAEPPLLCVHV